MSLLFSVFKSFSFTNCLSSSATLCSELRSCLLSKAGSSPGFGELIEIGLLISLGPLVSSIIGVFGHRGELGVRAVVSLTLRPWPRAEVLASLLVFRTWRTALETLRIIDCEPSSLPNILAISSSMVRSPPALHLGRLGDAAVPFEPADGGAGGALGVMYVSLSCCFGIGGRVDERFGGTMSSIGDCNKGPEIDLPFTVGV